MAKSNLMGYISIGYIDPEKEFTVTVYTVKNIDFSSRKRRKVQAHFCAGQIA